MGFILFFVIILNLVAIALIYYCLADLDKKNKIIFIAAGIAVIYVLTLFVYWISTKDIAIKEVSETGENIITFIFVPINSILVLPLLAKSYEKYNSGRLDASKFRNRVIVLAVILIIALVIECSYFKDIQNGVVNLIEQNMKTNTELNNNDINEEANVINQINEISEKINQID